MYNHNPYLFLNNKSKQGIINILKNQHITTMKHNQIKSKNFLSQPLITAMGRSFMHFLLMPASWQVSTTSVTFLYDSGACAKLVYDITVNQSIQWYIPPLPSPISVTQPGSICPGRPICPAHPENRYSGAISPVTTPDPEIFELFFLLFID